MIRESFSLRRAAIGILFPGQPELRDEDKFEFYKKVSAQRVDVPQFNQTENSVHLIRQASGERANSFQIEVGRHQDNFRFLVAEKWPGKRTLDMIGQDADTAWDCFREVWSTSRLGQKPVLVEVTLRTTVAAEGGNATEFLANDIFRLSQSALAELGRQPQGLGLRLMFPVQVSGPQSPEIPLDAAGGYVRVETLIDDPSRLYIEAQFRWPSAPIPPEARTPGGPEQINPEVRRPSAYLEDSYSYVKNELTDFLLTSAEE